MTKKQMKCGSCDYEWETKSKLDKVTCPNCLNKVTVEGDIDGRS